jgi:hypothetical protein
MKTRRKMLGNFGTFVLILALILQTMSPLACTLINRYQSKLSGVASCCIQKLTPFQTPKGMPAEQCCFKTGPLLGKAAVPDALEIPQFVGALEAMDVLCAAGLQLQHPAADTWLASSSPPSLALLSVFRI